MNLLLTGKTRVFALVTCATLTCGCQGGMNSLAAPTGVPSISPSSRFNSDVATPDDVITAQAAPVSYWMNERMINSTPSGYSGTCTVAGTHAGGLRVKVDGQGVANSLIKLHVVDVSDPLLGRTTEYVDVNQQGAFRTNWQPIEPERFAAGDNLQCWLMSDGEVLANSSDFSAP